MSQSKGFTLIEVMIAVVVVSILVSIALPSYQAQVASGRRADGQTALMSFAQAMERQYTLEGTYAKADGKDTDINDVNGVAPIAKVFASEAPNGFYTLRIMSANNQAYTLRAIPQGAQVGDGSLEVTSTGIKRWDRNNNNFDAGDNCWEKSC